MDPTAQPLIPRSELWEWQHQGLCRTRGPELFFHPEGERGPARRRRQEEAKKLCAACPVLDPCREHALRVGEPYGIWGGMTEEERVAHLNGEDASSRDPGEDEVTELVS